MGEASLFQSLRCVPPFAIFAMRSELRVRAKTASEAGPLGVRLCEVCSTAIQNVAYSTTLYLCTVHTEQCVRSRT